jgi:hypothetical protein
MAEAAEAPLALAKAEASVDRRASSLRFVYPFLFEGESLRARASAITGAAWTSGDRRHPVWRPAAFPTDDLLSHVAAFLNPAPSSALTARLWQMDGSALRSPAVLGGGARNPGADWRLGTPAGELPFVIAAVEVALFPHGVGFLTVTAMPVSSRSRDWFDFGHHFRFAAGERACPVAASRVTGLDPSTRKPTRIEYFPELAGGMTGDGTGRRRFAAVIDGLLGYARRDAEEGRWWREVFVPGMLLPFSCLFIDGLADAEVPAALYRARNFFHHRQLVHPSRADPGPEDSRILDYARHQWFFFSLNGGGFLACDAPSTPFFRETLPAHVTAKYFLLFLLALQQRFVLMRLSQQVATEWVVNEEHISDSARAAAFARIRDDLLAFTAQGYFAQTMQEEHHHRCYQRWQEAFQLTRLYEEVSTEVREMHAYLDLRHRTRSEQLAREQEERSTTLDRRLNRISWLLGIPVSLLLVVNVSGNIAQVRHLIMGGGSPPTVQGYDLVIALAVDIVGVLLGYLVFRLLDRPHRRRRTP